MNSQKQNEKSDYSIIAELQLSPRSPKTISLSKPIKESLKILKKYKELQLQTHAMGTNIATKDIDVLLTAVKEVQDYLIQRYPRVVTTLKIDQRTDKPNRTFEDKLKKLKDLD